MVVMSGTYTGTAGHVPGQSLSNRCVRTEADVLVGTAWMFVAWSCLRAASVAVSARLPRGYHTRVPGFLSSAGFSSAVFVVAMRSGTYRSDWVAACAEFGWHSVPLPYVETWVVAYGASGIPLALADGRLAEAIGLVAFSACSLLYAGSPYSRAMVLAWGTDVVYDAWALSREYRPLSRSTAWLHRTSVLVTTIVHVLTMVPLWVGYAGVPVYAAVACAVRAASRLWWLRVYTHPPSQRA